MIKKICLAFVAMMLLTVPAKVQAQTKNMNNVVTITFTPNHADWNYQLGESVEFTISVRRFNIDLPEAELTYSWGMEMSKAEESKTIKTDKNGTYRVKLKGSKVPGFKTITATAVVDGEKYWNYLTVGFAPDKIAPTTTLPDDFMAFWIRCLTEARKTQLEPLYTLQPDLCTPQSDVYMVRYQVSKANHYFYGMLRVPKGTDLYHAADKKYPALLEVPGAGVRSYKGMTEDYTKAGIITLQVGIHGIPVNLPDQLYLDLRNGALQSYNAYLMDNRDTYYYNRVYVGCVRAVDLICSLPCVDTTRVGVTGGSQGGALTLVVAGLSDKITCAGPAYPALCELAGSQRGRIDGWPRLFTDHSNQSNREEKMNVAAYYDAVNFARFIKAPVFFIQGYNDRVCPPTSTMSAYNVITAEKQLLLPLDCAHWLYTESKNKRRDWLIDKLTK